MKIYFLLLAALITFSTGCKKDSVEKNSLCRINKLTSANGKEIKITYNADGNYAKIENAETGETSIATYSAGSIIYTITKSSTGLLLRKTTMALGKAGMVSSQQQEQYNAMGTRTSLTTTTYEYSGTELMKSTFNVSGIPATNVNTYSWTNGNMTSSFNDMTAANFEYYVDKPVQQGDWISITNLINSGIDYTLILKNKNLMKNYFGGLLTYSFDAKGGISAMYHDGSLLYNVAYECN